jgi:hypothetical protein
MTRQARRVLALRIAYTLAAMALVVWLLRTGQPLGAVAVLAAAVWARGAAESGRLLPR